MKKLLWMLLILIIVFGILLFLVARYADRIVDPYIRSLVEDKKPMKHLFDYKDIRVNLISHIIKIRNARIYPDSTLSKDEHIWIEIKVDMIKLTEFRLLDLLFHKTLNIDDFILLNPLVELNIPVRLTQEVIEEVDDTAKVSKSPLLTHISLESMILSGGSFRLIQNNLLLASSDDINLVARQIKLIKNNKDEPIGYTYGDVKFWLSNIKLYSETGFYDMSLDKFTLDKVDSTIVLTGFKMMPKYDKKELSTKLEFQKERFDIRIDSIKISRIGYRRLLEGLPLQVSKILIEGVDADIFKDKNLPFDMNKFPQFYNESFLKVPVHLIIDTVSMVDSRLLYNELAEGRTEPGLIRLEEFNLQSYNLTNHPEADSIENEMKFYAQAMIMGEGPMNLELVMPLEGNLRQVQCSGSVGAMQLSPLNAMLEPSLNIKFNGGKVTRMTFDFKGDNNTSDGWMEFLYKDVDVELLKKDQDEGMGFLSFMANTVALSNNPAQGKGIKSVKIGTERDKNKGLINFVWKTIQSGMVRTILPMNKYVIRHKSLEKEVEKESRKQKKQKN